MPKAFSFDPNLHPVHEAAMVDDGAPRAATLKSYYETLQSREGVPHPLSLVGSWDRARANRIAEAVADVFGSVRSALVPDFAVTASGGVRTNQSKGNVAASYVVENLFRSGGATQIASAHGSGYPDMLLTADTFRCALEMKATSFWNANDSNRRVLTSSSEKLRRLVASGILPTPPCHMLMTVIYSDPDGRIDGLRLDFLEPSSPVNIRLEASTSQALLACGSHVSRMID